MKKIDMAQLLADLPRLTTTQCRERAGRMLAATQRLHDEGDSQAAAVQAQTATAWATLALSCPPAAENPNDHARYGAEAALRRAAEMAPEAPDGVPWRQWLLDCAAAGIEGPAWPAPPSKAPAGDLLTVRVEHSREDLERLTIDTLGRLGTEVYAIIADRVRAAAAGPTDVLGTPRGGADERWRAGTGGGAAQWNG